MHDPSADQHAVCLKRQGLRTVWRVERPGGDSVTVKTWPLTLGAVLKLIVGQFQPQRHARAARRLSRHNIPTPAVLRPWRLAQLDGRRVVEMELAYEPGTSAADLLADPSLDDATRRRIARKLGTTIARIAAADLVHPDFKVTNLIMNLDASLDRADPVRLWVIDVVGVRRCRDRPAATARMLERAAVSPAEAGGRLPASVWMPAVRAAIGSLDRSGRAAVVDRLRRYRDAFTPARSVP